MGGRRHVMHPLLAVSTVTVTETLVLALVLLPLVPSWMTLMGMRGPIRLRGRPGGHLRMNLPMQRAMTHTHPMKDVT